MDDIIDEDRSCQIQKAVLTGKEFFSGEYRNISSVAAFGLDLLPIIPVDLQGNFPDFKPTTGETRAHVYSTDNDPTNSRWALVDSDGHVQVDVLSSTATAAPSGIVSGAKTVAVAGTAEALGGSAACQKIIMTAEDDNTGKIYYGGASVSSSIGDYLFPAQKITIEIDDISKVFIDADTSTDGVKFTYFT